MLMSGIMVFLHQSYRFGRH